MLAAVYTGGIDMEHDCMVSQIRRKTSLTLDAEALDCARELGVNVSAVAEAALVKAVAAARREKWLAENADAFAAQSDWHARNGHPLADIIAAPGGASWKS
jgi:antitoxin CcdA|tara:strand:+ start:61 stop:363 length:303 start_codon:yes stop_codon:yes gene_type:complete